MPNFKNQAQQEYLKTLLKYPPPDPLFKGAKPLPKMPLTWEGQHKQLPPHLIKKDLTLTLNDEELSILLKALPSYHNEAQDSLNSPYPEQRQAARIIYPKLKTIDKLINRIYSLIKYND